MNAININLEVIHYIDSDGEVVFEVYTQGVTDPIFSSSVSIFSMVQELVEIMADGKDQIEGGMAGIYNPSITQRLNNLVEKVQEDGNKNITVKVKYESKGTGNSSERAASGAE